MSFLEFAVVVLGAFLAALGWIVQRHVTHVDDLTKRTTALEVSNSAMNEALSGIREDVQYIRRRLFGGAE